MQVTVIEWRTNNGGWDSEFAHIASSPEKAIEWIGANNNFDTGPHWWWAVYEEEVDCPDDFSVRNLRFYDRTGIQKEQGDLMDEGNL